MPPLFYPIPSCRKELIQPGFTGYFKADPICFVYGIKLKVDL